MSLIYSRSHEEPKKQPAARPRSRGRFEIPISQFFNLRNAHSEAITSHFGHEDQLLPGQPAYRTCLPPCPFPYLTSPCPAAS